MIHEVIVITCDAAGTPHVAPMGLMMRDGLVRVAPFRPSTTLDNLLATRTATMNMTDDVRVFAGCLTGRRAWPTRAAEVVDGRVLASALAHRELTLDHVEEDEQRPRLWCRVAHEATHSPFAGFNRAQAAVVEAAILVSRLDRLPAEKIRTEIDYHRIAIDKTAGPREQEAWGWLMERVAAWEARAASGPV